jgi:hypothetical protein
MSVKRNGSSGRSMIGLTLVLLVLCAIFSVVAINLVVVPLFNASNQQVTNSGAVPQIAKATATIDFEEGPPPPGTPTGEMPTPLPTLSKDQLHKAPTAEYPPDVPTLEPTQDIGAVAATLEPVVANAPSDKWVTYTDPNFGFSFQYPSNWYVEAPEKSKNEIKRVSIVVRNYVEGARKGDKTTEQLKIDIDVDPLPDSTPNLETWAAQLRDPKTIGPESNFTLNPVENIQIDGMPAVRWTETAEMIPQGSIIVGVIKEGRIYVLTGYPATSKYLATFDQILSSLRLP